MALRKYWRISARSLASSATISIAPCKASSTVGTSSLRYSAPIWRNSSSVAVVNNSCANGSKPRSLAMDARVRFFGRNGKYKSSNSCNFIAFVMARDNSSVNFPCSSIDFVTSSLRCNKLRKYFIRSSMSRNCSSFNSPVTSFRYRAINGTVLPSSNKVMAAST